jgi:hypothetical protein
MEEESLVSRQRVRLRFAPRMIDPTQGPNVEERHQHDTGEPRAEQKHHPHPGAIRCALGDRSGHAGGEDFGLLGRDPNRRGDHGDTPRRRGGGKHDALRRDERDQEMGRHEPPDQARWEAEIRVRNAVVTNHAPRAARLPRQTRGGGRERGGRVAHEFLRFRSDKGAHRPVQRGQLLIVTSVRSER